MPPRDCLACLYCAVPVKCCPGVARAGVSAPGSARRIRKPAICGAFSNAGGGTRTPDKRIMIHATGTFRDAMTCGLRSHTPLKLRPGLRCTERRTGSHPRPRRARRTDAQRLARPRLSRLPAPPGSSTIAVARTRSASVSRGRAELMLISSKAATPAARRLRGRRLFLALAVAHEQAGAEASPSKLSEPTSAPLVAPVPTSSPTTRTLITPHNRRSAGPRSCSHQKAFEPSFRAPSVTPSPVHERSLARRVGSTRRRGRRASPSMAGQPASPPCWSPAC